MDHISFQVNSRADPVIAQQKLDEAGIPHGEVTDLADAGLASCRSPIPTGYTLS